MTAVRSMIIINTLKINNDENSGTLGVGDADSVGVAEVAKEVLKGEGVGELEDVEIDCCVGVAIGVGIGVNVKDAVIVPGPFMFAVVEVAVELSKVIELLSVVHCENV